MGKKKPFEGRPQLPIRVVCECSSVIRFKVQTDRVLCKHCNHWVYRTPSIRFRYKLEEEMKKSGK